MIDHYILADVTSHRVGFGVHSVVDAATRRSNNPGDPNGVLWIRPSHLTHFPLSGNALVSDDIGTTWDLITKKVEEIKTASPNREIIIATWDHITYNRARTWGAGITAVRWFDWLDEDRGSVVAKRPAPFAHVLLKSSEKPSSELFSVEYLANLVEQYLSSVRATSQTSSIYRSQLRPALVKAFPELNVVSSSPFLGNH